MTDIILSTQNGEPVASSRQIAESFGKEHRNVMRDIENLMTAGVLKNEQTPMFYKTEYTHEQNGQTYPMYLMNRDGFTLLAMGFTGKAALEWKLKYIQAFNAMEKQLAQRPQLSRAELMAQALIAAHDELEHKDRQIAELTPKGIFADAVNASKKSILVGELAKLLCQNSVQIGQNRLFFGVWNDANDAFTKKYGGLNVIDFEITALSPGGCAKQLTAYVKREEDAPCVPQ